MATYIMFGKYSVEALKGISAARTKKVADVIKKLGGKVEGMYVLLGKYDLVLTVDLPGTDAAMRASIELAKLTGIAFTTNAALPVEQFDKMMFKK